MMVVSILVGLFLLMLVMVISYKDVLEELYMELILVYLGGVLNKGLIPDVGFVIMGIGGSNALMLFESR